MFFLLSALCVGGVLGLILSRNAAYAALWVVLSFAALGALFGLLDGPFIAVVQIIIYAGAVMVLFLFVVMMIPLRPSAPSPKRKVFVAASLLLTACLAALIFLSLSASRGTSAAPAAPGFGGVRGIGRLLFTDLLYPFEITSLVIMAALVGALILAKKRKSP
ncbi:MAG: NADH-quinone oxidoreductase subunit J [Candidatus Aminicenantes bacterium]|nr:NADH-quinone oxidoreductase subunit J [Candidatus Aminicenantes bacterium]